VVVISNIVVNILEKQPRHTLWSYFLLCFKRIALKGLQVKRRFLNCFFVLVFGFIAPLVHAMPDELYEGMVGFELESGNFFNALVLMDDAYRDKYPVSYATALKGFNIEEGVKDLLEVALKKKQSLGNQDYFNIGKIQYHSDECIPALKSFKKIKKKLSLEDKQEWAFYRASCFIKLGSNKRAIQALKDILGGTWASYAYYNLALSFAEGSRDKRKALGVLRIARDLNAGKTREEKSLKDKIHLAAGALYLEEGKPDAAINFFKKVYLDSESAPKALYLNGVSHHDLGDFRAATQAWSSAKTYPLVDSSVAESLLAIPYAYERSGYISQALEAYFEASASFENELEKIDKVDGLLERYGAQKILIEESDIEGLEWFLAKDVVTNTTRASYYNYFMQDNVIYDAVELHAELSMLLDSLSFWRSQLAVFDASLIDKRQNFKSQSKNFNVKTVEKKITKFQKQADDIKSNKTMTPSLAKNLQIQAIMNSIDSLRKRLLSLQQKIHKGRDGLKSQLEVSANLNKGIKQLQVRLINIIQLLDKKITILIRQRLGKLRIQMVSNFERSEQGLIHIFEGISESKRVKKHNLLNGRYK